MQKDVIDFVGVNPELIRRMTEEERLSGGWRVELDGTEVTPLARSVRLWNEKMGLEVRYGMRAEGFDGVLLHKPKGGGSASFPFVIWKNDLWIGLIEEQRYNMGGKILSASGGYVDHGETHIETAQREFEEEVGVKTSSLKMIDLNQIAEPTNTDVGIADTSRLREGVHYYALEFLPRHVYSNMDKERNIPILSFRKELLDPNRKDYGHEKIFGCNFYHWKFASTRAYIHCGAMFSRLLVHLISIGRADLSFS
jgi:8-oxo-dGTP pyrophosphatase MutT (NUDIX family)